MAAIARSVRLARPMANIVTARAIPMCRRAAPLRSFTTTQSNLLRKYTKNHEWVELSADQKTGTVGITNFAAEQLGDLVFVELPQVSDEVIGGGESFAAVESVKSASDIYAPLTLKVTAVNTSLEETPSTVNKLPEDDSTGGGWLARVELGESAAQELEQLMDPEAYKAFVEES